MRKIHSLLAAACLLAASCNKEEIQSETDKADMYHITVAVTGSSPKGSVHIYNLDGVRFRNERTGTSAASVDENFTDKAEYSTEKPVSQITVQGILYSKESAIITMQIKKRRGKRIQPEQTVGGRSRYRHYCWFGLQYLEIKMQTNQKTYTFSSIFRWYFLSLWKIIFLIII